MNFDPELKQLPVIESYTCIILPFRIDINVKVFRIFPEFDILRLTFHRKSASKCLIKQIYFSALFSVYLKSI